MLRKTQCIVGDRIGSYLCRGVTLIETIVFITIVSIALATLVSVYNYSVTKSVDPVTRTRAIELAQAQLDTVLARKFDNNTPTGGIPACGSTLGPACLGISPDTNFDDVGDYNGFVDNSHANYSVSVSVVEAGNELGAAFANSEARRITVTVTTPGADSVVLSAYKTNF